MKILTPSLFGTIIFMVLLFQPANAWSQNKKESILDADVSKFVGCGKDTDCKGTRICENGKCVEPESVSAKADMLQKPETVKTTIGIGKGKKTGGKGNLDPGKISKVLKSKLSALKMCYEEAVKKAPSIEGRIKVRFTIKASGEVTKASASSKSMDDLEFATCLIKKVKALTFPAPKGGDMTIIFPLIFKKVTEEGQPPKTEKKKGSASAGKGTKVGGKGTLDPALVHKVIKSKLTAFKMCYEKALSKELTLKGKISIRFTIGQSGQVTMSAVESDEIKDPALSSCLVEKVKALTFPKPKGGDITYVFPFVFKPFD